jgi:hypothetical protein
VIANIFPFVVNLSAKSNWFFIRAESDGCAGSDIA